MATITITVTVAGGKFVLDGVSQATYSATPGNTYKFDQADASNGAGGGHPLRLATAADAAGSTEYTTGVTTNGSPGSAGAYTQIVVTATTTQALHYYCSNHTGMGGLFNVGGTGTVQYQDRQGFTVQNKTSDPLPYAQALINHPYAGAWSSGDNLNTARYRFGGAVNATLSAGLVFGAGSSPYGQTEEYDGTSWTNGGSLNTGRYISYGGGGTQTACITAGGYNPAGSPEYNTVASEQYNGASWTEVSELNEGRIDCSTFGTSTAALLVGGGEASGGPGTVASVESWNGASWTETTDIPTVTQEMASLGTATAGLIFGGSVDSTPTQKNTTVEWNGSSWTAGGNYPIVVNYSTAFGSQTDGISGGGQTGSSKTAISANYNGNTWTVVNSISTARLGASGNGTGTSGFVAGGETTTSVANTEEWTFAGLPPATPAANYSDAIVGDLYYNAPAGQFKAIKNGGAAIGTWASGNAVNTARRYLAGVGSKTAGLIFGGGEPPTSAKTEEYDGTSWSEVSDLNTAQLAMGSAGTTTSGMSALGAASPGAQVEDWNGTSWTSNPHSLNSARQFPGGDGASNDSALMVGGEPSPNSALTEVYDGSSWSEKGDLNDARNQLAGVGTVTAFLAVGGSPNNNSAEEFNGTSWTEVSDMSNGEPGLGATGDTTLAIAFGGGNPVIATNEAWNGTSWTEVGDLANGRNFFGSSNNSGNTSAFAASGENDSTLITNTEEWTAADFEIKTVTTS